MKIAFNVDIGVKGGIGQDGFFEIVKVLLTTKNTRVNNHRAVKYRIYLSNSSFLFERETFL
jgi:hypothetical protein